MTESKFNPYATPNNSKSAARYRYRGGILQAIFLLIIVPPVAGGIAMLVLGALAFVATLGKPTVLRDWYLVGWAVSGIFGMIIGVKEAFQTMFERTTASSNEVQQIFDVTNSTDERSFT